MTEQMNNRPYERFPYLRLIVKLDVLEHFFINADLGSALRGIIGRAIRYTACSRNWQFDCKDCSEMGVCAYATLFNNIRRVSGQSGKISTLPNTFVIYPLSPLCNEYYRGDVIQFRITLFDPTQAQIAYFLQAILNIDRYGLGIQRGNVKVRLVSVEDNDQIVYQDAIIKASEIKITHFVPRQIQTSRLGITFDTPLRLRRDDQFTDLVNFRILMQHLMRRSLMLSQHVRGDAGATANKELVELARMVRMTESGMIVRHASRYSEFKRESMSMTGLIGVMLFSGDFKPFLPYLQFGEITHVGRNTSMGMGHYVISYL